MHKCLPFLVVASGRWKGTPKRTRLEALRGVRKPCRRTFSCHVLPLQYVEVPLCVHECRKIWLPNHQFALRTVSSFSSRLSCGSLLAWRDQKNNSICWSLLGRMCGACDSRHGGHKP